jgi:hypothetical protein
VKGKALLFTFLIPLVLAGIYLGYNYWTNQKSVAVWDLVPSSAVAVYQQGNCTACVDSVQHSPISTLIAAALLHKEKADTALINRTLQLAEAALLVSVHKTTRTRFDAVFYLKTDLASRLLVNLENDLKKRSQNFLSRNRILNGITIKELAIGKTVLTWVELEGFSVISLTPILVEDVIRTAQTGAENSFKKSIQNIATLPTTKNDGGDIFLKLNEFVGIGAAFTSDVKHTLLMGKATVLDVKKSLGTLVLNGFTNVDSTDRLSVLSFFQEQSPVPFELKNYISNDAQFVFSLGFSDGVALGKRLQKVQKKSRLDSARLLYKLTAQTIERLYATIGNEVAVFSLETAINRSSKLLLIKTKEPAYWEQTFTALSEITKADTVFVENFSEYVIKKMVTPGLVDLLLPTLVGDFSEIYFTQIGSLFLLSEDIIALKTELEHIDQENTWGKSVDKNRFLETTLLESNVNFYVDPSKIEKLLSEELNNEWKIFFLEHRPVYKSLHLIAIQFSHLNENFYTHLNLAFSEKREQTKNASQTAAIVVSLTSKIASKPISVKNHTDKKFEILLQDSAHVLYLIGNKGEVLWQKKLDGAVKGKIDQIDFFANGKLQYVVTTEQNIYVIDRLGNYVHPFPKSLTSTTNQLRVIDYDHSRKYRFLLTDTKGVLRMMDMQGHYLDGWKELDTKGELLATARHHRVGKDYLSVLQKKGLFALYNRRGETIKNFPIDLKGRPLGDYYLQMGDRSEKPHFVFVLAEGYRIQIGLNGEEISRETLVKPSTDTNFRLEQEVNEKSYVIVRQSGKNLAILNDKLEEVLINEFIGLSAVDVHFYDFGSGNVFYSLVDKDQELGYVYNGEGKLLSVKPYDCTAATLMWEESQLKVAIAYRSMLRITTLE